MWGKFIGWLAARNCIRHRVLNDLVVTVTANEKVIFESASMVINREKSLPYGLQIHLRVRGK